MIYNSRFQFDFMQMIVPPKYTMVVSPRSSEIKHAELNPTGPVLWMHIMLQVLRTKWPHQIRKDSQNTDITNSSYLLLAASLTNGRRDLLSSFHLGNTPGQNHIFSIQCHTLSRTIIFSKF